MNRSLKTFRALATECARQKRKTKTEANDHFRYLFAADGRLVEYLERNSHCPRAIARIEIV